MRSVSAIGTGFGASRSSRVAAPNRKQHTRFGLFTITNHTFSPEKAALFSLAPLQVGASTQPAVNSDYKHLGWLVGQPKAEASIHLELGQIGGRWWAPSRWNKNRSDVVSITALGGPRMQDKRPMVLEQGPFSDEEWARKVLDDLDVLSRLLQISQKPTQKKPLPPLGTA